MKRLVAALAVAFLVAAAAGVIFSKRLFTQTFAYAGTIEATRIDLPSRVATVVDAIWVEEGQTVAKDQKIADLACEELEVANNLATENYDRARHLKKIGSLSEEAFEAAQNHKQDSDTRMSWCKIKAPAAGTVLTKYLEAKEWVNPGTKIVTVADLGNLWTYFYVPQATMSRLKIGAVVEGVIPELDHKAFKGTIAKINDEAEFTPKNVQTRAERTRLVFGVKVAFANPDRLLKPGMTIESALE